MAQKFKCVQLTWRDNEGQDHEEYVPLSAVEARVGTLQAKLFGEAIGWAFENKTGRSPNRVISYKSETLYDQHGQIWQDEVEEAPSNRINSQFVQVVTVLDPVTKNPVEVEIRRLDGGLMLGIDGSYLAQDVGPVHSPYDPDYAIVIPDDEPPIVEPSTSCVVFEQEASNFAQCLFAIKGLQKRVAALEDRTNIGGKASKPPQP